MKKRPTPWIAIGAALLGFVCLISKGEGFAQTPAPTPATLLGQVVSAELPSRTLTLKTEDGSTVVVALAEKGTVVKVAPGEKSLQNAAPIEFAGIVPGDRVLVRGGSRVENKIEGALRIVVMAKSDLAARDESDLRAWRERGVAGTLTSSNAAASEFTIKPSGPAPAAAPSGSPAPQSALVVDASKATLHRYADTSVKFDDAKPATVAEMAVGDQVRILGARSADGSKLTAEKVVFGSFKTMALAIEKVDAVAGVLNVKDLESNRKFTISVVTGASIRKIPAEMGAMLAMMAGGAGGAARPGGAGRPMGGEGAARGGGAGQPAAGMAPGGGANGRPGASRGGRGMEDLVERMPSITLADLKKDDWIGAVVGKIDTAGKAVAFNMLAGIEVFASRANRSGGVDVGMPAGLLDGGLGVP